MRLANEQEYAFNLAIAFSEAHPDEFDDTFVRSLESQLFNRGKITDRQFEALKRVIEAWHMEEWAEETGAEI